VSFNITFTLKEDKTIDLESVVISGSPPVVPIRISGHTDSFRSSVAISVGDLSASATVTD
jgi:hypothetical protein